MNFFKRRRILKKANVLELTPFRKHQHEELEDNKITLLIPKFKNEAVAKFVLSSRRSKYFKINLDEFGSAVWLEMDGKKNVAMLCAFLIEKFGDKIQPVEDRLSKFLFMLYEQRYISFNELKD